MKGLINKELFASYGELEGTLKVEFISGKREKKCVTKVISLIKSLFAIFFEQSKGDDPVRARVSQSLCIKTNLRGQM